MSVRNNRHEALEMVEAEDFPEDMEKGMEKQIQDLVQQYNKKIEDMLKEKEEELMTI